MEDVRHRSNPVRFRTKKSIASQRSTFQELGTVANFQFLIFVKAAEKDKKGAWPLFLPFSIFDSSFINCYSFAG